MNFASADVQSAVELYRQAVAEDTHFALAYARLSLAESALRMMGAAPGILRQITDGPTRKGSGTPAQSGGGTPGVSLHRLTGSPRLPECPRAFGQSTGPGAAKRGSFIALSNVYARQLRFDDAMAVDERVAQYDPGNPKVFFDNAITFLWAGRNDKVQPALERALTLDPTYEAAAGMLAEFLIKERGDVEGARRLLRGGGRKLQVQLALTYLLTREYDQAIRLIEELPDDFSMSWGAADWSRAELLGLFLSWAGHDQRARQLLEPARPGDRIAGGQNTRCASC